MKISIITPIYKGNRYLNKYLTIIEKSISKLPETEVIWVNDSPDIPLEYDETLANKIHLKIINNKENCGIHRSRVKGLQEASGEYILFLDQDDEIMEDTLISQYKNVQGYDMVIGNGYFEDKNGLHDIFLNRYSQDFATKKISYILIRDFIVSPGQCLIKKQSIPNEWIRRFLNNSGTDDFLLWLLMFNNNCRIVCNYSYIYIHKYTGENLSLYEEKMYNSQLEMLDILSKTETYNKKDLIMLKRTLLYKHNYKKNFWKETIKNLDIFLYNAIYRILWKGYRI